MFLVQILLPSYDNERRLFAKSDYDAIAAELTERFGGLTAYTRSPAEGHWKKDDRALSRDEIVVLEIMCETLDEDWWRAYRRRLESDFRQHLVVIRAQPIVLL
jgi:hypothetical protein